VTEHRILPLGVTPRLLSHAQAAAYCSMSMPHFDQHVAKCVPPQRFGTKCLWDIRALDQWLDARSGLGNDASVHANKWAALGALDGDSSEGR
jgi:hypothetical protein